MQRVIAITAAAVALSACSSPDPETAPVGSATESPDGPAMCGTTAECHVLWEAHSRRMVECLTQQGWDATYNPTGRGFGVNNVSATNREQFMLAKETCESEIGEPPIQAPPDAEQLRTYYDNSIAAKACLENEGFTISEPPTFETFAADYERASVGGLIGDLGPWSPWNDIDSSAMTQTELADLELTCPQPGW